MHGRDYSESKKQYEEFELQRHEEIAKEHTCFVLLIEEWNLAPAF